jgi:1,4-dihydroxy-2-naphthoyl-CoA hydrolase
VTASSSETTPFDARLGLEVLRADGDEVVARLPVTAELHQPYGIVHGGVYCAVAETTATVGGARWLGDRGEVVGVNNTTSFLRAVREGVLDVRARPVHRGRTQQLWNVEITDGQGRVVARGDVRLQNVPSGDAADRSAAG